MFSHAPRCHYQRSCLAEVICQFRFPEILTITANPPADFQELIRSDYPQYLRKLETLPPKIVGVPGNYTLENQQQTVNYQFAAIDNTWRVNLTGHFISLSCAAYTGWEEFAGRLDRILAAFIRTYRPAYFDRIGLRYLNFISREKLDLSGRPFSQLISPAYLGPLGEDDVSEIASTRCTVDAELALRGGCRVKLHTGPGLVTQNGTEDKEVKFIFDQDLYMPGKISINLSAGALQTLHSQAFSIFRGAITDILHEAMEPQE